jgi:hypothetical protein
MAVSTTQSIWRSGGGDQTRTSYCGSGVMVAEFYVSNAAVTTAANVVVSSASNAPVLVLPEGAVILSVAINDAGTGHIDLGTVGVTSGTADTNSLASNMAVTAGTQTSGLTLTAASELSYVTALKNSDGAGTVGGYITYFVVDPLVGQQNV